MRYDLKKFLFVGAAADKDFFFKRAQHIGVIQFIDSNPALSKASANEVQHITDAIKVLRGQPPVEQEEMDSFFAADGLAYRIIELKKSIENLQEEQRLLTLEINRIEIFDNFSMDDIRFIEREGDRCIQFFCAKEGVIHLDQIIFTNSGVIHPLENVIYIGSNYGLDYFISINKEKRTYNKMVEIHIERPLGELRHRLQEVYKEIHDNEAELKKLARYNLYLHHALVEQLNYQNLHKVKEFVQYPLEGAGFFAVEGWIPENKILELHTLVENMHVYSEEIAIEPKDRVPTCLENEGLSRIGEDIIKIYDTPSHKDKDPSLWVLWFFALFFAIIVGDAGYGLVYLGLALYLTFKYAKTASALSKRLTKLIFILGAFIFVWGVITNSFFGYSFGMDSPTRKLSLIQWLVEKRVDYHMERKDSEHEYWVKKYPTLKEVKDPHEFVAKAFTKNGDIVTYDLYDTYARGVLLELALGIGIIHIIISMLRYVRRNWIMIGWIPVLIGGYLFAPTFLGSVSMFYYLTGADIVTGGQIGLQLIALGIIVVLIIGIYKHKFLGIFEVMTLLQLFSDVLSYLRLFALGLAGGIVGVTINELAAGMPVVLAVILIVFGHITNMILGIMSGVIHGLRLNFLEWYHYSFEGGGKPFLPLRLFKNE